MIFLDTNYLVSLFIDAEKHHKRSLEIANQIKNEEKVISRYNS
jgi:predicted nucleic acid-binding protein